MSFLAILCLISLAAAFPAPAEIAQTDLPVPLTNAIFEKSTPGSAPTKESATPKDHKYNKNYQNLKDDKNNKLADKSNTTYENGFRNEYKNQNETDSNLKKENNASYKLHNSDEKYHVEEPQIFDHKTKEGKKDSNKWHVEHKHFDKFQGKIEKEPELPKLEHKYGKDSDEDEGPPVSVIIKVEDKDTRLPILSIISWLYCHWPSFPLSFKINYTQGHVPLYISDILYY